MTQTFHRVHYNVTTIQSILIYSSIPSFPSYKQTKFTFVFSSLSQIKSKTINFDCSRNIFIIFSKKVDFLQDNLRNIIICFFLYKLRRGESI